MLLFIIFFGHILYLLFKCTFSKVNQRLHMNKINIMGGNLVLYPKERRLKFLTTSKEFYYAVPLNYC